MSGYGIYCAPGKSYFESFASHCLEVLVPSWVNLLKMVVRDHPTAFATMLKMHPDDSGTGIVDGD